MKKASSAVVILQMVVCLALMPAGAWARDTWKEPYEGVKVLIREVKDDKSGDLIRFYAAIIDVSRPDIHVVVSPPRYRGKRTSKFAEQMGAQVALNGGFWKLVSKAPIGPVVSAGRPWSGWVKDRRVGFFAMTKDGRAWIQPPQVTSLPPPEEAWMVVSGMPVLVQDGQVGKVRGCGYICMEHPRSAVGVSADGKTIYLVSTDGRTEGFKSTTPGKVAEFLLELGAWDAITLDGGGSTTMYVEAMGGMINTPPEGKERSVLNHIGIIIGDAPILHRSEAAPPATPSPSADVSTDGLHDAVPVPDRAVVEFQDDDFIPLGQVEDPPRMRQMVALGIAAVALLAGTVLGVLLIRRRRGR